MCLILDQFLWGHSSRVCDISCSKLTFSKNSFRNTIRVSNGLDPDWVQTVYKGYQQTFRTLARKYFRSYQCQDYKFKGLNAVFKAKSSIIIYLLFTLRGQTDCLGKTQSVTFIHSCFEKVFEFQFIHIFCSLPAYRLLITFSNRLDPDRE